MATVRTCADCSTQYALDLAACPHCGSSNYDTDGGVVRRRLPLFVNVVCTSCGLGPWTVRLNAVKSGLIELPTLACASCGSRVPVTWPPEEEPMSPKISALGGATNAREADVSPAAVVSAEPQVVAEDDLGLRTPVEPVVVDEPEVLAADYDGMTLAELREAAGDRELPTYGTKAQLIERLKDADTDAAE